MDCGTCPTASVIEVEKPAEIDANLTITPKAIEMLLRHLEMTDSCSIGWCSVRRLFGICTIYKLLKAQN